MVTCLMIDESLVVKGDLDGSDEEGGRKGII